MYGHYNYRFSCKSIARAYWVDKNHDRSFKGISTRVIIFFKYILLQHMSSNEILKHFSREIILIKSYVYTHYFSYFIRMRSNHSFYGMYQICAAQWSKCHKYKFSLCSGSYIHLLGQNHRKCETIRVRESPHSSRFHTIKMVLSCFTGAKKRRMLLTNSFKKG